MKPSTPPAKVRRWSGLAGRSTRWRAARLLVECSSSVASVWHLVAMVVVVVVLVVVEVVVGGSRCSVVVVVVVASSVGSPQWW